MGVTTDTGVLADSASSRALHAGPLTVARATPSASRPGPSSPARSRWRAAATSTQNDALDHGSREGRRAGRDLDLRDAISGPLTVSGATAPVMIGEPATGDARATRSAGRSRSRVTPKAPTSRATPSTARRRWSTDGRAASSQRLRDKHIKAGSRPPATLPPAGEDSADCSGRRSPPSRCRPSKRRA